MIFDTVVLFSKNYIQYMLDNLVLGDLEGVPNPNW